MDFSLTFYFCCSESLSLTFIQPEKIESFRVWSWFAVKINITRQPWAQSSACIFSPQRFSEESFVSPEKPSQWLRIGISAPSSEAALPSAHQQPPQPPSSPPTFHLARTMYSPSNQEIIPSSSVRFEICTRRSHNMYLWILLINVHVDSEKTCTYECYLAFTNVETSKYVW